MLKVLQSDKSWRWITRAALALSKFMNSRNSLRGSRQIKAPFEAVRTNAKRLELQPMLKSGQLTLNTVNNHAVVDS
jgi:hypothetical protein